MRIVASSGLDEWKIQELVEQGAPIDGFGVGTELGVSGEALLHTVMESGRLQVEPPDPGESRNKLRETLSRMPPDLLKPEGTTTEYPVTISKKLKALHQRALDKVSE